ncbi:MAG: DUF2023 family protein [Eubacteriales bacterium]|nr:DUF2023 family protein [Eubacteriales bacterium]
MNVSKVSKAAKTVSMQQVSDLKVFHHHIYEFKKGIRNLILTTEKSLYRDAIETRLNRESIDYVVQEVSEEKINVFFGAKNCVDVVKTFVQKRLNELTPEQDFILGIMLGYDRLKQCERYLQFKNNIILFNKKSN